MWQSFPRTQHHPLSFTCHHAVCQYQPNEVQVADTWQVKVSCKSDFTLDMTEILQMFEGFYETAETFKREYGSFSQNVFTDLVTHQVVLMVAGQPPKGCPPY